MKTIDLRSDTVTRPSQGMREAMARAEVGDDVYGEDPTVRRLEALAAELTGKRAGLFVPSGTMANQIALGALTQHGDVVLAGQGSHILRFEGGAAAALWGLQIETLGHGGFFDAHDVLAALPSDDAHLARVSTVAFENTHNVSGGRVWRHDQMATAARAASDRGLGIHLDGARIFNASLASGVSVATLAEPADTVCFCLSKGLGAPVGSLICSDEERAPTLHRIRKRLGGGMRQVGILAAAGLYALEHHVERLEIDHANARRLADGLVERGFVIEEPPSTNIVVFRARSEVGTSSLLAHFAERNVLMGSVESQRLRAVTHLDVSRRDIEEALDRTGDAPP